MKAFIDTESDPGSWAEAMLFLPSLAPQDRRETCRGVSPLIGTPASFSNLSHALGDTDA